MADLITGSSAGWSLRSLQNACANSSLVQDDVVLGWPGEVAFVRRGER